MGVSPPIRRSCGPGPEVNLNPLTPLLLDGSPTQIPSAPSTRNLLLKYTQIFLVLVHYSIYNQTPKTYIEIFQDQGCEVKLDNYSLILMNFILICSPHTKNHVPEKSKNKT